MKIALKVVVLSCAVMALACVSPVTIMRPAKTDGGANPVTEVEVLFASGFKPAGDSWRVDLDGTAVSGFHPGAMPGSRSVAPLSYRENETSGAHTLKLRVTCGFACVYDTQTVHFTTPVVRYNTTELRQVAPVLTNQFETVEVYVGVQLAPSVDIHVQVEEVRTPSQPAALLRIGTSQSQMQAPGTPISVTIPKGYTRGVFYIAGQSVGNYTLSLNAPGVVPTRGYGSVWRKQ
jgi:hypothetical protein